ncbi:helix-turn-helix domain-containing protein [Shewanella sp. 0m-4]
MIDHICTNFNSDDDKFRNFIGKPLNVKGGKVLVDRLLHLFNLRNKVELSEIIGVSTGSIATWQTRSTVPYELLIRIHLATGVSIEYLLFDKAEDDLNVMSYCINPNETPSFVTINQNIKSFHYPLHQPIHSDGGLQIINRLQEILEIDSKAELGRLCSINIGTLATWQTRKTTPHELLCRVHLATGVSMHYLCFGKEWIPPQIEKPEIKNWMEAPTVKADEQKYFNRNKKQRIPLHDWMLKESDSKAYLSVFEIDEGDMKRVDKIKINDEFLTLFSIDDDGLSISIKDTHYFIDPKITTITKGQYLFRVNDSYQLGELRHLPDGNIYLIEDQEKFIFDPASTIVLGKVTSILKRV